MASLHMLNTFCTATEKTFTRVMGLLNISSYYVVERTLDLESEQLDQQVEKLVLLFLILLIAYLVKLFFFFS